MSCVTCVRRKRTCSKQRPRCSQCKDSRLGCKYDGPPEIFQFMYESEVTLTQNQAFCPTKKIDSADWDLQNNTGVGRGQYSEILAQNLTSVDGSSASMCLQHQLPASTDEPSMEESRSPVGFDDIFPTELSFWTDDLYQTFSLDEPAFPDADFSGMIYSQPAATSPLPQDIGSFSDSSHTAHQDSGVSDTNSTNLLGTENSRPTKKVKLNSLPVHVLAQHFSRQLTGHYSFKPAAWTFYTYFFNRFTSTHPWVLSSILAWTSAHLYYSKKAENLDAACAHYDECMNYISETYGRSLDNISDSWPSEYDPIRDSALSNAETDDIDAILVACFFLAQFDLISARPQQFRKILRFVSHVLRIPNVRNNMGGVRSRVSTWFCILDTKASTFQLGDGAVLDAVGGQDGVEVALNASVTTLQQEYSVTYPEEELEDDKTQLPLLKRMLRLMALLGEFRKANEIQDKGAIASMRACLDIHARELEMVATTQNFQGRSRSTWLVLQALYNAVEIAFSRAFFPSEPRHSADEFATKVIRFAQQLGKLSKAPHSTPPQTKIWPLPIVMAAIEVRDPVYAEWVLEKMRGYETTSGDHYVYAKKFIEAMWKAENEAGRRVDFGVVMKDVKDGLVI